MDQPAQVINEPPVPVSVNLQPPPKEKKGFLIILLVILGLILAGGLLYAGMQIGKKQTQVPVLPSPVPAEVLIPTIPVSTPIPDLTAGWITYTNKEYRYSIKYPESVKMGEGLGYEDRIQEIHLTFFGPGYQGPGEWTDGFGITFAVIKNPNQKTPIQLAQEFYEQSEEDIKSGFLEGDISKCKSENVVKDGVSGARFTYCTSAPGTGVVNFSEWFIKNGITYQVYAVLQNENYKTIFDQILSTFKFLP